MLPESIVPCRYGYVKWFKDRPVARFLPITKWGAITQSREEVIPQQYDELFFYDGGNLFTKQEVGIDRYNGAKKLYL